MVLLTKTDPKPLLPDVLLPLVPLISSQLPVSILTEIVLPLVATKTACSKVCPQNDEVTKESSLLFDDSLDEFSSDNESESVSDQIISTTSEAECSLFNSVLEQKLGPPASCRIKEISGKGIGMVATRKLYPGDLVLAETPMLTMPEKVFDDKDHDVAEDWMERAINRLSSTQREVLHFSYSAFSGCSSSIAPPLGSALPD